MLVAYRIILTPLLDPEESSCSELNGRVEYASFDAGTTDGGPFRFVVTDQEVHRLRLSDGSRILLGRSDYAYGSGGFAGGVYTGGDICPGGTRSGVAKVVCKSRCHASSAWEIEPCRYELQVCTSNSTRLSSNKIWACDHSPSHPPVVFEANMGGTMWRWTVTDAKVETETHTLQGGDEYGPKRVVGKAVLPGGAPGGGFASGVYMKGEGYSCASSSSSAPAVVLTCDSSGSCVPTASESADSCVYKVTLCGTTTTTPLPVFSTVVNVKIATPDLEQARTCHSSIAEHSRHAFSVWRRSLRGSEEMISALSAIGAEEGERKNSSVTSSLPDTTSVEQGGGGLGQDGLPIEGAPAGSGVDEEEASLEVGRSLSADCENVDGTWEHQWGGALRLRQSQDSCSGSSDEWGFIVDNSTVNVPSQAMSGTIYGEFSPNFTLSLITQRG